MARTTITRALLNGLPPLPAGAAKQRIFDGQLPGFIAERLAVLARAALPLLDAMG